MQTVGNILFVTWSVGLWAQPGLFKLFYFQAWPSPWRSPNF